MSRQPVRVEFTPRFLRVLKRLRKKYRNVANDLLILTDQLENGETPGDQIQGTGHAVYKARVKNTDTAKGKRGGYRVIYYLKTAQRIILLMIYTKSELADMAIDEISRLIEEYDSPEE